MSARDPFDDQLRAYLDGRAAVPIPPDLVVDAEAAGRSRSNRSRPQLRLALGIGAVVVAVLLVASRVLYLPSPAAPLPTSAAAASAPAVAAGSSSTPSPTLADPSLAANGFPSQVLGLPVISVADARALISGGQHQGRAMAIGGWWSEATLAMSCPAPIVFKSAVEGYCSQTALAPTDAQIDHYQHSGNSSSESFQAPDDSLRAREVSETAGWREPWKDVSDDAAARQRPQRVVVIGHVGDPRAWQCVADAFASCQKEFVIDAFAWVEGRSVDAWNDRGGPEPHLTVAQARAAVHASVPDGRLVTISYGDDSYALELDPRIAPGSGGFWLARSIAGAVDGDGTTRLVEVLVDDQSGDARTLEMSFAPGSEPGSVQFVADGTFFKGLGELPTLYVAILDPAGGRLREASLWYLGSTPAVLPEGDYSVVSWSGDPTSRVASPTQPPRPTCRGSVHVVANTIVSVRIFWDSDLTCQIRDGSTTPN
jgi:hypothetical protein